MSQPVVSITALADPKAREQRTAASKLAKVRVIKASSDKMATAIVAAEKTSNAVYAAFDNTAKPMTTAKVAAVAANLKTLYAGLGKAYKQASKNLAASIAMNVPAAKVLAQMESLAILRNKVASLHVQAVASLAADEDSLPEEILPVDEQGYVVTEQNPAAAPANEPVATEAGTLENNLPTTTAPADGTPATGAAPVAAEPELPEDEGAFTVPDTSEQLSADDLNMPNDGIDEAIASALLASEGEAPAGNDNEPTSATPLESTPVSPVPQTRSAADTRDLRQRTASATSVTAAVAGDDGLDAMMRDLAKP